MRKRMAREKLPEPLKEKEKDKDKVVDENEKLNNKSLEKEKDPSVTEQQLSQQQHQQKDEQNHRQSEVGNKNVTNSGSNNNDQYCPPPQPIETNVEDDSGFTNCTEKKHGLKKKSKRASKINGQNPLQTQTSLSTSLKGKSVSPTKSTLDQKLTRLTTAAITNIADHKELSVLSPEVRYAIQRLLDSFKKQFLDTIEKMKCSEYRDQLLGQVDADKKSEEQMTFKGDQLNKHTDRLISDFRNLLKTKLEEINIHDEYTTVDTLISEAHNIVMRHHEIKEEVFELQEEVSDLERQRELLLKDKRNYLIQKCLPKLLINELSSSEQDIDKLCRHYIVNEINPTLNHRKSFENKLIQFETEIVPLEKRLQQQIHQQPFPDQQDREKQKHQQCHGPSQVPLQQFQKIVQSIPQQQLQQHQSLIMKGDKKNLSRPRSQEWQDIPAMPNLNKKNPQLLTKKNIETKKEFEARKLSKKCRVQSDVPVTTGLIPSIIPSTNTRKSESDPINDPPPPPGGVIQVTLKGSHGTDDVDVENNDDGSASVFRVVRKRVSEPSNNAPAPHKKQSLSSSTSFSNMALYLISGQSKTPGPPSTPSPSSDSVSICSGTRNEYAMSVTPMSLQSNEYIQSAGSEKWVPTPTPFRGSPAINEGLTLNVPMINSPIKWQNKISNNLDHLFSFASEVNGRQKSTENNSSIPSIQHEPNTTITDLGIRNDFPSAGSDYMRDSIIPNTPSLSYNEDMDEMEDSFPRIPTPASGPKYREKTQRSSGMVEMELDGRNYDYAADEILVTPKIKTYRQSNSGKSSHSHSHQHRNQHYEKKGSSDSSIDLSSPPPSDDSIINLKKSETPEPNSISIPKTPSLPEPYNHKSDSREYAVIREPTTTTLNNSDNSFSSSSTVSPISSITVTSFAKSHSINLTSSVPTTTTTIRTYTRSHTGSESDQHHFKKTCNNWGSNNQTAKTQQQQPPVGSHSPHTGSISDRRNTVTSDCSSISDTTNVFQPSTTTTVVPNSNYTQHNNNLSSSTNHVELQTSIQNTKAKSFSGQSTKLTNTDGSIVSSIPVITGVGVPHKFRSKGKSYDRMYNKMMYRDYTCMKTPSLKQFTNISQQKSLQANYHLQITHPKHSTPSTYHHSQSKNRHTQSHQQQIHQQPVPPSQHKQTQMHLCSNFNIYHCSKISSSSGSGEYPDGLTSRHQLNETNSTAIANSYLYNHSLNKCYQSNTIHTQSPSTQSHQQQMLMKKNIATSPYPVPLKAPSQQQQLQPTTNPPAFAIPIPPPPPSASHKSMFYAVDQVIMQSLNTNNNKNNT